MLSLRLIPAFGILIFVSACSMTPDKQQLIDPEDSFGYSVRHMIRAQTYAPAAVVDNQEPGGLDGGKAAMALKTYRTDKSGAAASAPVSTSIGR